MASKILVCFGGPLDGQRVSLSSYMRKIKDGKGGVYYRDKVWCEDTWKEGLIYEAINRLRLNTQIFRQSCDQFEESW
jgi:hypothetical protein